MHWFVFNGDADGICAAHQLRLEGQAPDRVVTGVKRDIALLARVMAGPGDRVTVADISLDANRAALERLLADGIAIEWYDHHHAGKIPPSPHLTAHIDIASDACSSLIVDARLGGRQRAWAVVAAFGDNLHEAAHRTAATLAWRPREIENLRELGELMNYNAYGESEADLHVMPAELFARVAPHPDPRTFIATDPFVAHLRDGFAADMAAAAIVPSEGDEHAAMFMLPAQPWARRVNGVFANELARSAPGRAHAVLVTVQGGFVVSVRAPLARPTGADALCRAFAGGGRARAAGINLLRPADLESFQAAFAAAYA